MTTCTVVTPSYAGDYELCADLHRSLLDNMPDGTNRKVLKTVCDLFALSAIEDDRAWFIEHGRLSINRSKAVTSMVDELCRRVRPHAVDLVDGFGVPRVVLQTELY